MVSREEQGPLRGSLLLQSSKHLPLSPLILSDPLLYLLLLCSQELFHLQQGERERARERGRERERERGREGEGERRGERERDRGRERERGRERREYDVLYYMKCAYRLTYLCMYYLGSWVISAKPHGGHCMRNRI